MNCKYCGKEYKVERYLLAHEEKCEYKSDEQPNNEELLKEDVSIGVEDKSPSSVSVELSDMDKEKLRLLSKLGQQIIVCLDAATKAKLELEFSSQGGCLNALKKEKITVLKDRN